MKLYFVINSDLNLSTGKACGQIAHLMCNYCLANHKNKDFIEWYGNGSSQTKIILKSNTKTIEELAKSYPYIRDNGLTEIEPNTLTCVCLGLHEDLSYDKKLKRLQLL